MCHRVCWLRQGSPRSSKPHFRQLADFGFGIVLAVTTNIAVKKFLADFLNVTAPETCVSVIAMAQGLSTDTATYCSLPSSPQVMITRFISSSCCFFVYRLSSSSWMVITPSLTVPTTGTVTQPFFISAHSRMIRRIASDGLRRCGNFFSNSLFGLLVKSDVCYFSFH